jgi:flagellar protein FliL
MSNAAAVVPAPEIEAEPAKGKSKLLIILVAVFGLLAGGGGGAAWFFHQKANEPKDATEDQSSKKKVEAVKPPVFNTLENFTVNLAGEGDHFLQLGIVLQLKDDETADKVKAYLPQIRNRILLLLAAKTAEDLQSAKGKEALIDEILATTREPLHADGENIQAVLLGGMLIQ